MKKNFWKNVAVFVVTLGLPTLVACGANNGAPVLGGAPLTGSAYLPCNYGQANFGTGCVATNPATWAQTCAYSGGAVTNSSDGTQVCRMVINQSSQAFGNSDYMGPAGGGGISLGTVMPGDLVAISASGHWGNNTCHFNLCWGSSCTCNCNDTGDVTSASTGLYAEAGGTVEAVQPSATFNVGPYQSPLTVGFNAPSMTCFALNVNVSVTRCQDINGLTHPCQ